MPKGQEAQIASIFEQRAEHLSATELRSWTAHNERDRAIVRKLLGPGAKLVIGPRGSGKSTLLRTAYFEASERESSVLAVYVNYANSLALEPLFHKQANALQIFRQWLLCKVVVGARDAANSRGAQLSSALRSTLLEADLFVRGFEAGGLPEMPNEVLSPSAVTEMLEEWSDEIGASRCILLMDDAAHAFSPEQQREFFEVFRGLRSRRVSGKAAVYPGITSYSANFHAGHDAELIEVWSKCDSEYVKAMADVVRLRLPGHLQKQLSGKQDLIALMALASFGLPRGFLNMLSAAFGLDESETAAPPTRRKVEDAIQEHAESVRALFVSLRAKLPRFGNFVEAGSRLEGALLEVLRRYNSAKDTNGKTNVVAIKEPLGPKFERVLNMLEYAGVVRAERRVSRGIKGRFRRYSLHNAIVSAENGLVLGKSYAIADIVDALTSTSAHDFSRTTTGGLLGDDFEEKCVLNLPNCPRCSTPRATEDQRYCMKCGQELSSASIYEELLKVPIEQLMLPKKKQEGILSRTQLKTVQDLLLDDELQVLLSVPYIGPVWAAKIRTTAEEFVSV